uniref:Uncharacterized protein n=1 Tax=Glossina pallidipes TaxID=7398 RepID=A0A1B0AFM2_GLOPL
MSICISKVVSSLVNSDALQCGLHDVYQRLRWPCWELRNSSNYQHHAVPSDQRDNPSNDDQDRDDHVHRNKKLQYCNCPPNLDQSRNNKHFETITNKTHLKPSGKPFGISKYSGQPQPQKLNSSSSWEPAGGRFSSKLRKVRAKGTVIEDSVERRRMVFMPGFTKRNRQKRVNTLSEDIPTNITLYFYLHRQRNLDELLHKYDHANVLNLPRRLSIDPHLDLNLSFYYFPDVADMLCSLPKSPFLENKRLIFLHPRLDKPDASANDEYSNRCLRENTTNDALDPNQKRYSHVPQPQKLNSSSSSAPTRGRFASTLRNVRSKGIVTLDSSERRRIVFIPGFTKVKKLDNLYETEGIFQNLHEVTNLSNSIINKRCSLKAIGKPRSSILGPKNIRTVPKRCAPPWLLTFMCVKRAKTLPRGKKSIPRDKSTSDCCQKVLNILGRPPSETTCKPVTEIPSYCNCEQPLYL